MALPVSLSDSELWASFRAGSEHAFNVLVDRHYAPLFRYGTKMQPDTDAVKDCLQDLFTNIWNRRRTLSEVDQVRFYLMASLRRDLYRLAQKGSRTVGLPDQHLFDVDFSAEHLLIVEDEQAENARRVSRLLNQLTPRQKEAVYLKFYENLDNSRIAELMNINYQVVANVLSLALRRLRELAAKQPSHGLLLLLATWL